MRRTLYYNILASGYCMHNVRVKSDYYTVLEFSGQPILLLFGQKFVQNKFGFVFRSTYSRDWLWTAYISSPWIGI